MKWNEKHINKLDYPDNMKLQQALDSFRSQYTWYEQQVRLNKKIPIDTGVVQHAWDTFLKLRNEHDRRLSNPRTLQGTRPGRAF